MLWIFFTLYLLHFLAGVLIEAISMHVGSMKLSARDVSVLKEIM
jgi:hypothetical protein